MTHSYTLLEGQNSKPEQRKEAVERAMESASESPLRQYMIPPLTLILRVSHLSQTTPSSLEIQSYTEQNTYRSSSVRNMKPTNLSRHRYSTSPSTWTIVFTNKSEISQIRLHCGPDDTYPVISTVRFRVTTTSDITIWHDTKSTGNETSKHNAMDNKSSEINISMTKTGP